MSAKSCDNKYFGCMRLKPAAYFIVGIGLTISVAYLITGISLMILNDDELWMIIDPCIGIVLLVVAGYGAVVNGLLWIGVYRQRTIFLRLWQLKTGASIIFGVVGIIVFIYLGIPPYALILFLLESYYRHKFNVPDDFDAVECQSNNK